MPYAHAFVLAGPRGLYDALHAEFRRYPTAEMVLHVARRVPEGTEVVEVWTSAEALGSWMAANAGPAIGAVAAAGWTVPDIAPVPFDPAGLIVPAAGIDS
jgi:hypothetical protein